jgi:hypothetical protein
MGRMIVVTGVVFGQSVLVMKFYWGDLLESWGIDFYLCSGTGYKTGT